MEITKAKILEYQRKLESMRLSPSTVKRRMAAVRKFCFWAAEKGYLRQNPFIDRPISERIGLQAKTRGFFAKIRQQLRRLPPLPTLSNIYEIYHSISITRYLHWAILIIFCAALGFGAYDQLFRRAPEPRAYPAALTPPKRVLSFQGRLTDSSGNPITSATNMVFKLYNVSSGGTALWNSGSCTISPDTDGIFSLILGKTSGDGYSCPSATEIDASVFSENPEVWLEITVGTPPNDEVLEPRIQIATVGYALNAETLQGYPPASPAQVNTIPVVDSDGNIIIAAASPSIQSTSGTFGIKGQALTLTTATGSDGNITLAPDGSGLINFTLSAPTGNVLNATDAQLGASGQKEENTLFYGKVANDNTNFNLLKLESGSSPTPKFTVDYAGNASAAGNLRILGSGDNYFAGNVGIGTTAAGFALNVNGTIQVTGFKMPTGATSGYALVSDSEGVGTWQDITSGGSIGPWTLSGSTLYPDLASYRVGIGTVNSTDIISPLYVTSGATTGKSLAIFNQTENQDILTASASGTPRFTITNEGNIISTAGTKWRPISNSTNALNIANSSGTSFVTFDTINQRVGIGTTSPSVVLHVVASNGNSNLVLQSNMGTNNEAVIFFHKTGEGSPKWSIGRSTWAGFDSQKLGIFEDDNQNLARFVIVPGGNVGIGTTSPEYRLVVVGNTDTYAKGPFYIQGTSSGAYGVGFNLDASAQTGGRNYSLLSGGGSAWLPGGFAIYDSSGNAYRFSIASTGRVLIGGPTFSGDTSGSLLGVKGNVSVGSTYYSTAAPADGMIIQGNIGIGTTTPGAKLEVAGTGWIRGATGATGLFVNSSGNVGIGTTNPGSYALNVSGAGYFSGNLGVGGTASVNTLSLSGALLDKDNQPGTSGQILSSTGTGVDWIDIGSLGVGGSGTANYLPKWTTSTTLGNSVLYETGGNIGIGTTGPGTYKLYVAGNQYISGNLTLGNNQILNSNGTATIIFSSTPSTSWNILDAGAWQVYNTANVGQAALAVNQTLGGDIFTASASGTTKFVITNSGNVGIGTTTPSDKLHLYDGTFQHQFSPGTVTTSYTSRTKPIATPPAYSFLWNGSSYSVTNNMMEDTDDYKYFGNDTKFQGLEFVFSTTGAGYDIQEEPNMPMEYWNGSAWTAFKFNNQTGNTLKENTNHLTISNKTWTWVIPSDWQKTTVNGRNAYWIRAKTLTNPTRVAVTSAVNIIGIGNIFEIFTAPNRSSPVFYMDAQGQLFIDSSDYSTTNNFYALTFTGGNRGINMNNAGLWNTLIYNATFPGGINMTNQVITNINSLYGFNNLNFNIATVGSGNLDLNMNNQGQTGSLRWGGGTNEAKIVFTAGGSVGIGTTTPGARLEVAGTGWIRGAAGTTGLFVNSSGNVGIGTTNPESYALNVVGSGYFSGDINITGALKIYNGATQVGEITTSDTTWLRINQNVAKNIYTPRYIRADEGFFVDSTSYGINGSGILLNNSLSGTYSQALNFSNSSNVYTGTSINLSGDATISGGDITGANNIGLDIGELNSTSISFMSGSTVRGRFDTSTTTQNLAIQLLGTDSTNMSTTGDVVLAQTFTATASAWITAFDAKLGQGTGGCSGGDDPIYGTIGYFSVSNNSPTVVTAEYTDTVIDAGSLPPASNSNYYRFTLKNPFYVVQNGQYVIAIHSPNCPSVRWYGVTPSRYGGGAAYFSQDGGKTWATPSTIADAYFRVFDGFPNSYGTLYVGNVNTYNSDLAEYYTAEEGLEAGDLVTISSENDKEVRKALPGENVIGVISTSPGLVLGQKEGSKNQLPVALVGKVPVKASTENGIILKGDPLTLSPTKPGIAVKAIEECQIIGYSLYNYTVENPEIILPIMAFIQKGWHKPLSDFTDKGELKVATNFANNSSSESNSPISRETNNILTDIKKIITNSLQAVLAEVKELTAEKITTSKIVSPLIESQEENLVIKLKNTDSGFGNLIIQNENGNTVSVFDNQGNAIFSGDVQGTKIKSKSGEISGDLAVGETLQAKKIVAEEIIGLKGTFGELLAATVSAQKIQGLEERLAQLEEKLKTSDTSPTSSPTPTPEITPAEATSSPTPTPTPEFTPEPEQTLAILDALDSNENSSTSDLSEETSAAEKLSPEEIEKMVNEILASTAIEPASESADLSVYSHLAIQGNLTVLGTATLADAFFANSINIGGNLVLEKNAINTFSGPLYIQNLGLGGIDILAGKIVIDRHGNVVFGGDIEVRGRLVTGELRPLEGQDMVINLASLPTFTSEGSLLSPSANEFNLPPAEMNTDYLLANQASTVVDSGFGKLLIKGIRGEIVASIDASGSALFAGDLVASGSGTFEKIIIASREASQSGEIIPGVWVTNASAGTAVLPAGKTETIIYSPAVREESLVYLTPLSSTQNNVLYVKAKKPTSEECKLETTPDSTSLKDCGWFKVGVDTPLFKEVKFNWWIIDLSTLSNLRNL
jgi:hypothetical protein